MLVVLWINGKVKVEKRVLRYINQVLGQVIVVLRIKKRGMALVLFHEEEEVVQDKLEGLIKEEVLIVSVLSKMMEIVPPKCHFEEVEAVSSEDYHLPKGEGGMPLPP